MAWIIIAVPITGRHPVTAAARRIGIVTADPDPGPVDPLMVTGNPNRAAIGSCPGTIDNGRRRRGRGSDSDVHRLRGSLS